VSITFRNEFTFFVWQPECVPKKTLQFNIRMSEDQRRELEDMCRRRGRPLSFQVEHLIALAKMLIEFCDGNDDLDLARERLAAAKTALKRKGK
jgi:hypothetical protein